MNIRSKTILGTYHSWACTMRNLLLEFQKNGHKLYLESINGLDNIPPELKNRIGREIKIPDIDIAYTMPRNFHERFTPKAKKKMAIYNYETNKLPQAWVGAIKHVDYVLPSSNFSKQIFLDAGWPEEKCVVIPHGINLKDFENKDVLELQTQKKFKFLNISIPHYRKNIDLLIESYFKNFSDQDDVCLVLKTELGLPSGRKPFDFEVDVRKILAELQKKYNGKPGGLPQIEIIQRKFDSIVPLLRSCDVLINTAASEGFGLPLLEGLAANKLVIAPRCSGQLDFLNDDNSLLIDVEKIKADKRYQYWVASPNAFTYRPKLEHLSELMIKAFQEKETLIEKFKLNTKETIDKFTWENAANKILELQ